MKRKLFVLFSMFAIVAIPFTSCQKDNLVIDQKDAVAVASVESAPISDAGVTPAIIDGANNGGNRTCGEVAEAFNTLFNLSIGQINYNDGEFDTPWPAELNVVVTNGTYVSFNLEKPVKIDGKCYVVGAVIVKGSNEANVYFYENGAMSDEGLAAPVNASGNPAGLSNLTFCFYEVECEEEECYEYNEETAWAGIAGGGAAWWFYIKTSDIGPYPIYAGQELVEGAFVNIVAGMLTIDLGDNLMLQDVSEAIKIQVYNTIPTRRPAAGRFTTYKGGMLPEGGIDVSGYNFVAVHLDAVVKVLVDCPEGEE